MEKFNQLSASIKSFELCFYWLDSNGIETLSGLYNWLDKDSPNRRMFLVENYLEARKITSNNKALKAYIG